MVKTAQPVKHVKLKTKTRHNALPVMISPRSKLNIVFTKHRCTAKQFETKSKATIAPTVNIDDIAHVVMTNIGNKDKEQNPSKLL